MWRTLFFHNLKLILFLDDQIQLEYIRLCPFPMVAIHGALFMPTDNAVVDAIKLILLNYSNFSIAKIVVKKIERVK